MNRLSYFLKRVVDLMITVVVALLGLRFILRLFDANADNGFVSWVYDSSAEVLDPFRNVFTTTNVDGLVIEFSTIFAILVYGLIAMLAYYLIDLLAPGSESSASGKTKTKRKRS